MLIETVPGFQNTRIAVFGDVMLTPVRSIEMIQPDVLAKGADDTEAEVVGAR